MERLTIEKIKSLKEAMRSNMNVYFYDDVMKVFDELLEKRNAEEQGLLLRSPCKVGDTIFVIPSKVNYKLNIVNGSPERNKVYEQVVHSIQIYNNGSFLLTTCEGLCNATSTFFKETWFLVKEEAEQALARMEKENG